MQRTQSRSHVQTYSQVLQMRNNVNIIPRSPKKGSFIEQPKKYNIDKNTGIQNQNKICQQPVGHAERKAKYCASDFKVITVDRRASNTNGRKVNKLDFVKREKQIKILDTSSYYTPYNPESDQSETSHLSEQNTSFANSQCSLFSKVPKYPNKVQNMKNPNTEIAQIKIQTSLGTICFSQQLPYQNHFLSNDQNYKLTLAYDKLHSEINYAQLTENQLKIGKIVGLYGQNKDAQAKQIENYHIQREKTYLRQGGCLLVLKHSEKNEQQNFQKSLYQLLGYCQWVKQRIVSLVTGKDLLSYQSQKIKLNSSTFQRAVQSYPEDNNFAHEYSFSDGRYGAELTISRSDDAVLLLYEYVCGQRRIVQILKLNNLKKIFEKAWKEEITKKVGYKIYHDVVKTIGKYWFTYISDL